MRLINFLYPILIWNPHSVFNFIQQTEKQKTICITCFPFEWKTGGRAHCEEVSTTGCVPSELSSEDVVIQIGNSIALWVSVL
jgi:hypothetical protein